MSHVARENHGAGSGHRWRTCSACGVQRRTKQWDAEYVCRSCAERAADRVWLDKQFAHEPDVIPVSAWAARRLADLLRSRPSDP